MGRRRAGRKQTGASCVLMAFERKRTACREVPTAVPVTLTRGRTPMFLAIDVGNTQTTLGLFDEELAEGEEGDA